MKQNNKSIIIRRYIYIIGLIVAFTLYVISYMVDTGMTNKGKWDKLSEKLLCRTEKVDPERGTLYAANGSVLAANVTYYVARLDFGVKCVEKHDTIMKYLPQLCDSLAALFPHKMADSWKSDIVSQLNRKTRNRSYRLVAQVTPKDFDRMKTFPFFNRKTARNFLYKEDLPVRIKPFGKMASRSIGNVGFYMNEKDTFPDGRKHGYSGLEMALDTLLYGVPGIAQNVSLNNRMVKYATTPAVRGYDIKTTIDIDIQDILEEELYSMCVESQAQWGTAILMEVETGEIKAISNLTRAGSGDRYVEGANNAVLGFEPGSVMKPISMLVALEDGIVSNIDSVMVTGHSFAYAGASPIKDGHGAASMPVREVIERSSNVGMAKIILRKYEREPDKFRQRLESLGFFEPLNTGIGGERTPYLKELGNKNWDRIELSRMAYGYTTKIPPMSTLAVYNAIANGGKYVRPRLIKELMRDGVTDSVMPVSYVREQLCSPKNAEKLKKMLNSVVWGSHGTARVLQDSRVNISGKTGTCFDIINGKYDTGKKRLAFCGFFPYEKPKYSCMVLMSHANRGAARCSGMVLKNVALKLYARGMLDNESVYAASKHSSGDKKGMMYATTVGDANGACSNMNIKHVSRYKTPEKVSRRTAAPSVLGLGLREAVAVLESAGLNVDFSGHGYVAYQSVTPGDSIAPGDKVKIKLKI